MSHQSLNRLLESSHKMIAKEVEDSFVARNELLFNIFVYIRVKNVGIYMHILSVILILNFTSKQLFLRSEYKTLESKYLMAQETIKKLQKELESMKRTQEDFVTFTIRSGCLFCGLITGSLTKKAPLLVY